MVCVKPIVLCRHTDIQNLLDYKLRGIQGGPCHESRKIKSEKSCVTGRQCLYFSFSRVTREVHARITRNDLLKSRITKNKNARSCVMSKPLYAYPCKLLHHSVTLHTLWLNYLITLSSYLLFSCVCRTGVFSLTQGYGMKFISSCRKPGFHPHPKEPPLYQVKWFYTNTFC